MFQINTYFAEVYLESTRHYCGIILMVKIIQSGQVKISAPFILFIDHRVSRAMEFNVPRLGGHYFHH